MTSEVTQAALEPCPNPWCNSRKTVDCEIRAAEAPILMPSRSSAEWAVACPVCPLQTPYFDTEAEAIVAWNTRLTAHSGEGRSGAGEDALREAVRRFLPTNINLDAVHLSDEATILLDVTMGELRGLRAALNACQSGDDEEEKAYRIGNEEGYQDAIQEIDIATGGDGEFCFCLGGYSERHCPDAKTMKARILDRFAARQSGEGEREATLEAALWSVLSYDQLLRQYEGPQAILFAGDVEKIDATYDAMIAKVTAALRATDDAGGAK